MNNDISVILLLYNTPEKALKNLKQYKNYKTYILDQNNNINLENKLKKIFPNLYYFKSKNNLGFSKGINFLAKKVKTKYFLCTQPDIIINKKNISNLKKIFSIKKDAILGVPKIPQYKTNLKNNKKKIYSVDKILGAVFLAETKKFRSFGMFDERYFFYWEDVDFCERVLRSKFNIYINTTSQALHVGAGSVKKNTNSIFIRAFNFKFGELLFKYKYKKLKIIKILKEPIKFFILLFFNLIIFNKTKVIENTSYILGTLKFLFYFKKN